MFSWYNKNGLIFWTEKEIRLRDEFVRRIVYELSQVLRAQNRAFEFLQVEAPLITPNELINANYSADDVWKLDERFTLRPETTMGSYVAAKELLTTHDDMRAKLPFCVWQHGKSFRREQDQELRHMRLKEFYQLEFQMLYSLTTANDYATKVIPAVAATISSILGKRVRIEASDRLPDYSESTTDIIVKGSDMEVCSISKRKDFEGVKNLEVAIGTDRLVYNFLTHYSSELPAQ